MDERTLKETHPHVYEFARIINPDALELGENVEIDDFVFLNAAERTVLGDNSCLHSGTRVVGGGELVVGENVAVTYNCVLVTEYPRSSSHMSTRVPKRLQDPVTGRIEIETEAFVGSGSVLMPGVTVGEGAVVAAQSYIDEDVPPWTIRYPDGTTARANPSNRTGTSRRRTRDTVRPGIRSVSRPAPSPPRPREHPSPVDGRGSGTAVRVSRGSPRRPSAGRRTRFPRR